MNPDSTYPESVALTIRERIDNSFRHEEGRFDGFHSILAVGVREELCFNESRIVAQGNEFHWLAVDLVGDAIGKTQPADRHALSEYFSKSAVGQNRCQSTRETIRADDR
jgi:hypothetical protein